MHKDRDRLTHGRSFKTLCVVLIASSPPQATIEMAESSRRPGLTNHFSARPHSRPLSRRRIIAAGEWTSHLDCFDFDSDTHTSRDTYATAIRGARGVNGGRSSPSMGPRKTRSRSCGLPGHHGATEKGGHGFCFFSNPSPLPPVGAIQKKGLKVGDVIDWDLHRTQRLFTTARNCSHLRRISFRIIPAPARFRKWV